MKIKLLLLITLFLSLNTFAQIQDPAKWSFEQKNTSETTADIIIKAKIEGGWHLYGMNIPPDGPIATSISIDKIENAKKVGGIVSKSKLIKSHDPNFDMDLTWYINEAVFVQKISFTDAKSVYVKGNVKYMLCNDESCLAPTEREFSLGKSGIKPSEQKEEPKIATEIQTLQVSTDSANSQAQVATETVSASKTDLWTPVIERLKKFGSEDDHSSLWLIFLAGLIGGFLALFTPCVWPIIPMTVSFFLKRSENKSRGRRDAILYGISIIVIYVTIGILITLLFGASALNALSTNAVFNLLFFALLVVFAISFFGAFEITLPSSWSTKMDAKADSTTGIISILFMAFTLALVSFSCTGPIIGTLLVQVSSSGSIIAPAVGMLGFAVALAIPFSVFAFFPTLLKSMPKSGGWLNKVKVTLAFIELALALKFLSVADLAYGWRILDREVFLALWIVIFILLGIYLLGKLRFSHDSEEKHTSVTGLFLSIISLSFAVYMIPGLWGAPLKAVSAFAPPTRTQDFNLANNEVHPQFTDYDKGMAFAASVNKPVVIDFTGHGCVNCRKMEASVWIDDNVKNLLKKDFVLISLYVDEKAPLEKPYEVNENGRITKINTVGDKWSYLQRHKFGANAQPYYVLLKTDGTPLNKFYFPFTEDPKEFVKWLKTK